MTRKDRRLYLEPLVLVQQLLSVNPERVIFNILDDLPKLKANLRFHFLGTSDHQPAIFPVVGEFRVILENRLEVCLTQIQARKLETYKPPPEVINHLLHNVRL